MNDVVHHPKRRATDKEPWPLRRATDQVRPLIKAPEPNAVATFSALAVQVAPSAVRGGIPYLFDDESLAQYGEHLVRECVALIEQFGHAEVAEAVLTRFNLRTAPPQPDAG